MSFRQMSSAAAATPPATSAAAALLAPPCTLQRGVHGFAFHTLHGLSASKTKPSIALFFSLYLLVPVLSQICIPDESRCAGGPPFERRRCFARSTPWHRRKTAAPQNVQLTRPG